MTRLQTLKVLSALMTLVCVFMAGRLVEQARTLRRLRRLESDYRALADETWQLRTRCLQQQWAARRP